MNYDPYTNSFSPKNPPAQQPPAQQPPAEQPDQQPEQQQQEEQQQENQQQKPPPDGADICIEPEPSESPSESPSPSESQEDVDEDGEPLEPEFEDEDGVVWKDTGKNAPDGDSIFEGSNGQLSKG